MVKISCNWWMSAAIVVCMTTTGCTSSRFAKATRVANPAVRVDRICPEPAHTAADSTAQPSPERAGHTAAEGPADGSRVQLTSATAIAPAEVTTAELSNDELSGRGATAAAATFTEGHSSGVTPGEAQPINLPTALMLTAGRNPQIAFAQARIEESRAQQDRAEVLWLPSLRAGANYNKHEGRIQDVAGTVIETSRGSVYSGLGAGAVGAGSPAVPGVLAQFHVTDAVFQPRIAQQTMRARNASARATTNDNLLSTALAYVQLQRASQEKAVAETALLQAAELERVTKEFAAAGEGLTSDHDRARTELAVRKNEVQRSDEAVQVASARLAQQIRWEYAQVLQPAEQSLYPVQMVDLQTSPQGLVAAGLSHRPEIAEARHLVCEAVERLNREKYAPLIPSVLLGVSYGGLAGGLGGDLINGGDRVDADAMAYWELRQLGFGEKAARREANSRIVQTRMKQVAMMDQIAREIVEAYAQAESRARQIETAEEAVSAAQDSFHRNWERIENGQGLPIEVLQSIQAMTSAQREYTRTVADYNVAQFTLHRSLGWPIDGSMLSSN